MLITPADLGMSELGQDDTGTPSFGADLLAPPPVAPEGSGVLQLQYQQPVAASPTGPPAGGSDLSTPQGQAAYDQGAANAQYAQDGTPPPLAQGTQPGQQPPAKSQQDSGTDWGKLLLGIATPLVQAGGTIATALIKGQAARQAGRQASFTGGPPTPTQASFGDSPIAPTVPQSPLAADGLSASPSAPIYAIMGIAGLALLVIVIRKRKHDEDDDEQDDDRRAPIPPPQSWGMYPPAPPYWAPPPYWPPQMPPPAPPPGPPARSNPRRQRRSKRVMRAI
jgi:hypothetical protein